MRVNPEPLLSRLNKLGGGTERYLGLKNEGMIREEVGEGVLEGSIFSTYLGILQNSRKSPPELKIHC
jgi:hypothetical protein